MIIREVNELFASRIVGARWIEDNALTPEEAFAAYTVRTALESIRDELVERVKREQLSKKYSKKARSVGDILVEQSGKQARSPRQDFFRFPRKTAA